MGKRMRRMWRLAWTVCAILVLGSVAWAQTSDRTAEQDDVFWESVSGCTSAVEVGMYLDEFPGGQHVTEARTCLEKLGKEVPASGKKTPSTEVERLLEVCAAHFAANRLTTGVGGTAVECYRKVQSLDPANMVAVEGLQRVFDKYAAWVQAALERGDVSKARRYLKKLEELNPEAPEMAELKAEITRIERLAEAERQQVEAARDTAERKEAERLERERAEAAAQERGLLARKWPLGKVFQDCTECPALEVQVEENGKLAAISRRITLLEWHACFSSGECSSSSLSMSGMGAHFNYKRFILTMDTQKMTPKVRQERREIVSRVESEPIGIEHAGVQEYARWLSRRTGNIYQGHRESIFMRVHRTLE